MIDIGKYNDLTILKDTPIGLYLGDSGDMEDGEEVLLPRRYVPKDARVGDKLHVFVYLDNDIRPVATTQKPYAIVGEFAFLRVKEMNEHGAFLDWGLDKDLFVPYSEQTGEPEKAEAQYTLVYTNSADAKVRAATKLAELYVSTRRPEKAKGILKSKEVGIHTHNNQQLAFANTIEGTGSLTQAGTGITTLSGSNSCSGATTIAAAPTPSTIMFHRMRYVLTATVSLSTHCAMRWLMRWRAQSCAMAAVPVSRSPK